MKTTGEANILILSCNTGQGHNSAGRAVMEALRDRGAKCEFVDALSFLGEQASELIAGSLVSMAVNAPRIFGHMYQAGEAISSDKLKSPVYFGNALYAENLRRYICERAFDAAVCPHLFPAEALTYLRRKNALGSLKTYSVATDYTCIPFLEETDMDAYFLPHGDIAAEYARRGIDETRLVDTGIPVSARFARTVPREEARAAAGIPVSARAFLVMTGGEGCGDAPTLTEKLLKKCGDDARVIVVCGHNQKLKKTMEERFGADALVQIVGFTDQVPMYMDACDVVITKPGGLSTTEAAVKNVPLIHSQPIPGCETANARFFAERGLSLMSLDDDMTVAYADHLSRDPMWRDHIRAAQKAHIHADAAARIADYILSHRA